MAHQLPELSYAYNALEPYIDAQTMEIHHGKHHGAYVSKLNDALTKSPEWASKSLDEVVRHIGQLPQDIRMAVRNNGGGHWNHSFFWKVMGPDGGGKPGGNLADAINSDFGSFEQFKELFKTAGANRFGSGWAWLIVNHEGKLEVCSTPNQDNPIMDIAEVKGQPILGVDVWEHAYYLKYQNRRPEYLENFFNVINWDAVAANFKNAR